MRQQLIAAGVKHLKEFGYPEVDTANILTDAVYKRFFEHMLKGTVADAGKNSSIGKAATALLTEIAKSIVAEEG